MKPNTALRLAGATAVATAVYHGIEGDSILRAIPMSDGDMSFVTGTYQLGTVGWIAGGGLLIGAARLTDQSARNLIVGATAALFGLPALGTLALTGGRPTLGGAALAACVGLALLGRSSDLHVVGGVAE